MEERMTICNMSIEGGARVGYVNPDETTFAYLQGPAVRAAGRGVRPRGRVVAADRVRSGRALRRPRRDRRGGDRADRHLGHQPGTVGRHQRSDCRRRRRGSARVHGLRARHAGRRARRSTSRSSARAPTAGCRISKRRRGSSAAATSRRTSRRWSCPGSQAVSRAAEAEGLDEIFTKAGFEWRGAGCSMCLAMNPDKLEGRADLRLVVEPQLQGPPGQPDRPHAADEPGDGRRRGARRRSRRRARDCSKRCAA